MGAMGGLVWMRVRGGGENVTHVVLMLRRWAVFSTQTRRTRFFKPDSQPNPDSSSRFCELECYKAAIGDLTNPANSLCSQDITNSHILQERSGCTLYKPNACKYITIVYAKKSQITC